MSCLEAARAEKRGLNRIWGSLCINCYALGALNGASAFEHVPKGYVGTNGVSKKKQTPKKNQKKEKKKSSCFSLIKQ